MGKKMWREQADRFFDEVLTLLRLYETIPNLAREPYKSDFFHIFFEAYRSNFCLPSMRVDPKHNRLVPTRAQRPLVCGDTIRSYAMKHGWLSADGSTPSKRSQDLDLIVSWWDEWIYAWQKHPKPVPRRYERKSSR